MKVLLLYVCLAVLTVTAYSQQLPLISVVEHFTNTRCSICQNRNPGFNSNVSEHPDILRLSIHPSAPYSSCILSQQNTVANDARTNYYGIYGGTPRLVINGNVISPSADYAESTLFDPYQNLYSSFAVTMLVNRTGVDSLNYQVVIKKVDDSSISNAILFSGNAEDTVFVNGGNGELEHYNVVRYAVQENITLPTLVGDSILINKNVWINTIWNADRISAFALLQNMSDMKLIQSGKSALLSSIVLGLNDTKEKLALNFFPNPATDLIYINEEENYTYQITNSLGQVIQSGNTSKDNPISIEKITSGIYYITFSNSKKIKSSSSLLNISR